MTIYFDEGFPNQFAEAFEILEKDFKICHIRKKFGTGTLDEDWMNELANAKNIVITKDKNIHKKEDQRKLYQENNIGIVILKDRKKGLKYWELFRLLANNWEDLIYRVESSQLPFCYVIDTNKARGKQILDVS